MALSIIRYCQTSSLDFKPAPCKLSLANDLANSMPTRKKSLFTVIYSASNELTMPINAPI
jgi:hypothetical protein